MYLFGLHIYINYGVLTSIDYDIQFQICGKSRTEQSDVGLYTTVTSLKRMAVLHMVVGWVAATQEK